MAPGANAGKVLERQLTMRAFRRQHEEEQKEEDGPVNSVYSLPRNPYLQLWDWKHAKVADYHNYNLARYLENYWHYQFEDDRVLESGIDESIKVGQRLFHMNTAYRCAEFPGTGNKLMNFVKLCLPARITRNKLAWRNYFGDLLLFFSHAYQSKILILNLHRTKTDPRL